MIDGKGFLDRMISLSRYNHSRLHSGSWQLLAIGTNGEERSRRTQIVPADVALLANEIHRFR
ncbi:MULTISPECIES: hypothetical protein [Kamptonema]|uniref:hypothetical protein n=1 Tax=Kamptonema TaxID=1501433 RepID=UPI0002D7EE58|nr:MULTISPECIES: hypothetical protein [Kamptonema]